MPARAGRRTHLQENQKLRARLRELEETLRAIRSGEVDALVVETAEGDKVYTLSNADQTYRVMVEEMVTGAATLSDEGVVLYCNPALPAMLGLPLEAVLGRPVSDFIDAPASLNALLRDAQGGAGRGDVSFKSRLGAIPTSVSLTPLTLEGAHLVCMIVTDLRDRVRREGERLQLAQEQAGRAAAEESSRIAQEEIMRRRNIEESLLLAETDRTELLERERGARTEAEQANRLKDEFLATLSHELRTPLTAIVGWAHLLQRGKFSPEEAARAVDTIVRNATAQTQMVEELLDVSRMVSGKLQIILSPVPLGEVIELAMQALRPTALAKAIQLDLALDPLAGLVLGDAGRLQQVLWNLLSNAIRFAPQGGTVAVRLEVVTSGLLVSVTDDGPGIDPSFLPHVFDRFRQADSSSTRSRMGLGLGLAISRHLVELHGGLIEAGNRTDAVGALFTVRLPPAIEPLARPALAS